MKQFYKRQWQGDNMGFIYKDYEAFKNGDDICYIGEFLHYDLDFDDYQELIPREIAVKEGYTRQQIEQICKDYELNIDPFFLFDLIDWQSPETMANELSSYADEIYFEEKA